MALTPSNSNYDVFDPTLIRKEPSFTFRVRYEDDYKLLDMCDDIEAMKQAIFKIINTPRYKYLIYSWDYGIELEDLIGEAIPYVYALIEQRIKEALLHDDRITDVYDFEFSNNEGSVLCIFTCDTIYGVISNISKEINV